LGAVALSQLGVVIYLVIRSISGYTTGDHANGHLFHEGIAWNLALGIAFLIAATRAQRTDGLMPILLVFVVVITAFSIPDLLTGTASVARVLRHLPAVLGLALMYLDNRGYGPTPHRPLLKDSDDTGPTPSAARAA
jgi:predicted anti-sigma-YlaC factor YlaD